MSNTLTYWTSSHVMKFGHHKIIICVFFHIAKEEISEVNL